MRRIRSVCGSLIASLLFGGMLVSQVFAKESIFVPEESERLGSITIQLEDTTKNLSRENVHMTIAKIADVVNGQFILHTEYANIDIDLNNIQNANELENAATKLREQVSDGETIVTDHDGTATLSNLSVGGYLVYASDIAGYEEITPVLVSIPVWDDLEKKTKDDIEIIPKHMPISEEKPDVPQTGDSGYVWKYLAIAGTAFILSGICIVVKSKGRTLQKK